MRRFRRICFSDDAGVDPFSNCALRAGRSTEIGCGCRIVDWPVESVCSAKLASTPHRRAQLGRHESSTLKDSIGNDFLLIIFAVMRHLAQSAPTVRSNDRPTIEGWCWPKNRRVWDLVCNATSQTLRNWSRAWSLCLTSRRGAGNSKWHPSRAADDEGALGPRWR